jgi:hypothetical protein
MRAGNAMSLELFHLAAVAVGASACSSSAGSTVPHDGGGVEATPARVTSLWTSSSPPPSDPKCPQGLVDKSKPPATIRYIYSRNPAQPIKPFYQWESNTGYCGEVSSIQAGLSFGQWMSQLDARSICGAQGNRLDAPRGVSLSQSGPDGFCDAHGGTPDYNAQFLLEDDASANATTCLSNARLAHRMYPSPDAKPGLAGYRTFLAWIKAETMAANPVTVGVLVRLGSDGQYDHIVSVLAVGTNHAADDPGYYDDDVLYFDDHGAMTSALFDYPAIPPGAGMTAGCVPFVYGYAFGELAKSRMGADGGPNFYSILIPGLQTTSSVGGNGIGLGPSVTGRNYAFSVTGPDDSDGSTLPVSVQIVGTRTAGVANPPDPVAGYDYENPFIGDTTQGFGCTNVAPAPMSMTLEVTVSGLTPGGRYNLYEYDFDSVSHVGTAAALAVPTSRFNALADEASATTHIVASAPVFTSQVTRESPQIVVFRAVPADAP